MKDSNDNVTGELDLFAEMGRASPEVLAAVGKLAKPELDVDMNDVYMSSPPKPEPALYEVHVTTTCGCTLTWTHLNRKQALALHKQNEKNFNVLRSSTEIRQFGWKEMA